MAQEWGRTLSETVVKIEEPKPVETIGEQLDKLIKEWNNESHIR